MKYTKEDLTPVNDKEEMLVMALLRKCRKLKLNTIGHDGCAQECMPSRGINLGYEYRKPEPKKLNIPWEFIKDEFICAAMDKNGSVWIYSIEPNKIISSWLNNNNGDCEEMKAPLNIDITDIDWRESLTFRPGRDTK